MATNDFLVFGGGSSPNVIDQATYAALSARLSGFQSGTALSAQLNKVWRQSSIMAAVLAQFTANFSGQNSVDDGSTATLLTNLQAAINAAGITAPQFDSSIKQATTAFVQRALGNFQAFYSFNTTPQNLTAAQAGSFIVYFGSSTGTFNLPAESGVPAGGAFLIQNISSATLAINRSGSDTIIVGASTVTSLTLGPGDSVLLTGVNNSSQWTATGAAQLPYASVMSGPNFTTAAQFDSSTRLATTAFTQRALGNFSGFSAFNANTTLTAFYAGQLIQWYGASGGVITLPFGSTMPSGGALTFVNFGSGPITVATQGSDFIWSAGNVQPVTLQVGDSLVLASRNSTEWDVAGGTAAIQFTQARGVTAAQFDSSTRLATTAFAQRASGGVVGEVRNASMNVSSASALATFTADEIVVETTLGGGFFRLAGFNKTINLATTGAGGMDTGSAPTSGFVALYAIYNPTTQTSALLATNAASALAPSVYGGGSMPSGYTASALLTVVPTNSSSQFAPVFVQDRKVNILQYTALSSSSSSGFTNTALSIAGGVPRNAKRVGGSLSLSNSTAANSVWVFYATSSGAGPQQYSINTTGSGGNLFGFSGLDLSAAQTMQYALLSISAGTCSYIVYISSYEI
ncbi:MULTISPECIES: hypothetical protein [unclassified Burkholderia]|uniref:hypothetical protein n=1 Tax=unclassified Burkholderia TaxID=2613784 RepID=UPI001FC7DFC8|nr:MULTISPECIES: hypothetical protein [unclassified Burkholderia]